MTHHSPQKGRHGVATISRLFQIIGLFSKRALWKRRHSAKSERTHHCPQRDVSRKVRQHITGDSVLQRVAVCCGVLQCVAVSCSVLQWYERTHHWRVRDDSFHWKCRTPEIHRIEKTKFLGTNSNQTKIPIWICTARYRGIWVSRLGGFWGCLHFQWKLW